MGRGIRDKSGSRNADDPLDMGVVVRMQLEVLHHAVVTVPVFGASVIQGIDHLEKHRERVYNTLRIEGEGAVNSQHVNSQN